MSVAVVTERLSGAGRHTLHMAAGSLWLELWTAWTGERTPAGHWYSFRFLLSDDCLWPSCSGHLSCLPCQFAVPTDENHFKVILNFVLYVLIYTRATALVCGGQRSEENSLDLFPPYAFTRPAEQAPLPAEPCCWPWKPCFKLYALYFC